MELVRAGRWEHGSQCRSKCPGGGRLSWRGGRWTSRPGGKVPGASMCAW